MKSARELRALIRLAPIVAGSAIQWGPAFQLPPMEGNGSYDVRIPPTRGQPWLSRTGERAELTWPGGI